MADQTSGNAPDVTLRDFKSGQKVFNRYKLIKVLGRGGMGIVWLAHDEDLERDVALKFVPDLIVLDSAGLSDLRRETKRSLELTHKNIVRIYDFAHDSSSACISMEYIDGGTLSAFRVQKERKIFETDDLAGWISQVCDALGYAHNHARIVHRDLKPSNLMVNQRGEIKVADFGIARSLTDSVSMLTQARGTSGTLLYMSPQQLDGERGTHLDDIYSLGATIYELLTSRPPFYSGNLDRQIHEKVPPSMMQRRRDLEIEGNPIPKNWEQTIAACLAKDPARRPQSAAEVAERLQLGAQQLPTVPILGKPATRRKVIAVASAAAVILFVLLALVIKPRGRSAPPKSVSQSATPLSSAEKEYASALEYFEGMNKVQIDPAKALQSVRRAADQHLPEAEARLAAWMKFGAPGIYIRSQRGDPEKLAIQALSDGLEKRATDGRPSAQETLGLLYALGLVMPKDAAKAAELYQLAADQGYLPAEHRLGLLYQSGPTGVVKDLNKAIGLQQKAADQGYADAQYTLGLLYRNTLPGMPTDFSKAADLLQKAVDQGHVYAPTDLGALYEKGLGVAKDLKKAAEIYRKGADKGNGPAKEHLAKIEQATQETLAEKAAPEATQPTAAPVPESSITTEIASTTPNRDEDVERQRLYLYKLYEQNTINSLKATPSPTPSFLVPAVSHEFDGKWNGEDSGSGWTAILIIKDGQVAMCTQQMVDKLLPRADHWNYIAAPYNKSRTIIRRWTAESQRIETTASGLNIYWKDWSLQLKPIIPLSALAPRMRTAPSAGWGLTRQGSNLTTGSWTFRRSQ